MTNLRVTLGQLQLKCSFALAKQSSVKIKSTQDLINLLQDKQLTLDSEVLLLGQPVYAGKIGIYFPVNSILQVTCQLDSLAITLSLRQLQLLASMSNQLNAPPQFGTQSMRMLIQD